MRMMRTMGLLLRRFFDLLNQSADVWNFIVAGFKPFEGSQCSGNVAICSVKEALDLCVEFFGDVVIARLIP